MDELPIFENGLPYLAPGTEFSSGWDSVNSLVNVLDQQGLQDGITVTAYYENLKGESEETEWNINPLRMAAVRFGEKGIEDLAKAAEKIAKNSKEELDLRKKELKVLEEIRSIQRQVYRPMEELERSQTEKGAVDPRVRGRIIAAICAEWEITEGNMDSRAVWERLVREGNEPPANAMKGLLEDMEDKRLIRGRFALGGDEIPKHGNMTISGVAPELCETA